MIDNPNDALLHNQKSKFNSHLLYILISEIECLVPFYGDGFIQV